ncbi:protein kinase superfamily protein [Actinidia rufa]|uniref:Protein kinase superfamily protein n=1 Tax=Actinidia rufa TaxID=165716 RepID=A0A7J0G4N0_9ERIC|nr:protein kinase superfamily protein [Actinidia rufa]
MYELVDLNTELGNDSLIEFRVKWAVFVGKPLAIEDSRESPGERLSNKTSSDLRVPRVTSSRREEGYRVKDRLDSGDGRAMLIDKQVNGSIRLHETFERKREKGHGIAMNQPVMGSIPKAAEGEQVAAGWPPWLSAVAGEAIKGWLPRRADSFEKLDKIGQGTYSNVYRARDLDQGKIVALKKVRFDNLEPESVRFMAREIHILRRLDHPNIIKLEGLVTSRMSCSLYLVFEYMEHDLVGLASHPGLKFTESQVKCYMQQLLCGLDHCHSRGVLHRDIKGSNLLIDNNGILKIADFGLASFYNPHMSQPLTSRVVTLWYRPPELLLGATLLWNCCRFMEYWLHPCGIICRQAYYAWKDRGFMIEMGCGSPRGEFILLSESEGATAGYKGVFEVAMAVVLASCVVAHEEEWKFLRLSSCIKFSSSVAHPLRNIGESQRLPHATIFKPQQPYRRCVAETFKDFPAAALGLMETLLSIDPADRGSAASALTSEISFSFTQDRLKVDRFSFSFTVKLSGTRSILVTAQEKLATGQFQFFMTKPLPCDPSSLPKYPPSKEFDAKVRDEEARRQAEAGNKGHRYDPERRGVRESRAVPAPDANAELASSMQRRQGHGNSKSRSEMFNPNQEEVASGFPIDPPRPSQVVEAASMDSHEQVHRRASHSGPLVHRAAWSKAGKNMDEAPKISNGADLSTVSSLVAARRSALSEDHREKPGPSQQDVPKLITRFPGSFKESSETLMKQDQKIHTQSRQNEDGRTSSKDPVLLGYGSKGNKIPLLRATTGFIRQGGSDAKGPRPPIPRGSKTSKTRQGKIEKSSS